MHTGNLFLVSAPSGAGKTSIVNAALAADAKLVVAVSHTTRPARGGEVDGKNYHFISDERFSQMIDSAEFLEHANVFGNRYGTSKAEVTNKREQGQDVILEIDWQGAQQIKSRISSCVMIFLIPPSKEVLLKRLKNRGTDSDKEIKNRFNQAILDLEESIKFDHVLVNDKLESVVEDIVFCIEGKANKINRTKQVAESLKSFSETN